MSESTTFSVGPLRRAFVLRNRTATVLIAAVVLVILQLGIRLGQAVQPPAPDAANGILLAQATGTSNAAPATDDNYTYYLVSGSPEVDPMHIFKEERHP